MNETKSSDNKSNKILRQGLKIVFFLALGAFFIWLFLRNLSPEEKQEIITHLKEAKYGWILLGIVFGFISNLSRSSRWKILLRSMGYNPRYHNVFMSVFIAYFANLAVPRLGEVSRCIPLARYDKVPFEKSFGSVVTERAVDLIVFVILFVLNVILQFDTLWGYLQEKVLVPLGEKFSSMSTWTNILIVSIILVVFVVGIVFVMKNKKSGFIAKVREKVKGFADGLKSILYMKRPFMFLFHSIFIWFMYFMMTWVVFRALPETSNLGIDAALSTLMLASIGMMVVQGGIGIYPLIVAEALTLYGIVSTTGYAMGWLLWSGQTASVIIAGLLSLIILPLVNKNNNEKTADIPQ